MNIETIGLFKTFSLNIISDESIKDSQYVLRERGRVVSTVYGKVANIRLAALTEDNALHVHKMSSFLLNDDIESLVLYSKREDRKTLFNR